MFFIRIVSLLPFFLLYLIADLLAFIASDVIRYRSKIVYKNLKKAFPEKSEVEIKKIKRDFYRNFMDTIVETLKLASISSAELDKRIKFEDAHLMTDLIGQGQSVVLTTSHLGNWEWQLTGFTANVSPHADGIYMRVRSDFFDQVMRKLRGKFGAYLIEKHDLMRELIKKKNIPRVIALVADQRPKRAQLGYWTTLLNQDTQMFEGAEKIAYKFDYPVFYSHIKRVKRGHYVCKIIPLAAPPYDQKKHAIIDAFVTHLEANIQESPSDWLWSHKRWKHSRPAEA